MTLELPGKQMATINQYAGETKQLTTISGVKEADLTNVFNSFFPHFERSDLLCKVSTLRTSLKPANVIFPSQKGKLLLCSKR